MIPSGVINGVINTELVMDQDTVEVSRTYRMTETKLQGYADKLEALKQTIYKALSTERYEYPIYSFSYGIELDSLIGKEPAYVKIELKRRVRECLLQDERIKSVENFRFETNGDELFCTFDIHSIYGDLTITQEVTI